MGKVEIIVPSFDRLYHMKPEFREEGVSRGTALVAMKHSQGAALLDFFLYSLDMAGGYIQSRSCFSGDHFLLQ
ncbi:MAG: hypothetical protein JRG73_00005 [Deltaproteobacteria bacterium]|nr:hypothetical protein [Deltaproteobacteria bacterium]